MNCPKCERPATMARPKGHDANMICAYNDCNYEYKNEESEKALGIIRVKMEVDGVMMDTYENLADKCHLFPSWYCLKFFNTYEERIAHDGKYHKIGDPQLGMVNSGHSIPFKPICGMENVVV